MEIINNPLLDNDGQVTGERHRQYSFEDSAGKGLSAIYFSSLGTTRTLAITWP